jgi:hypothetical protein
VQRAGEIVNHSTAHRDRVLQNFIRRPDPLEGMNATGGKGEIDGTTANGVARARVWAALKKLDLDAAATEECGQQSAGETTADENKFGHRALRWLFPENCQVQSHWPEADVFGRDYQPWTAMI